MDADEVVVALEEGRLEGIVQASRSTRDLHAIHNCLFQRTLELGVPRAELLRKINEATYDVARRSLLDYRDLKQMDRRMLEDYDPRLALEVLKAQITVMITACQSVLPRAGGGKPGN